MEIPYVVTPRKDTGLFNSKIAIWLFLASEVMLFGGLFSSYVFLRLGSGDPEWGYPWPERTLPVLPGLINTFILIASSVTVVFAWAALKMRQWNRFVLFMSITVACAAIFMVFKGVEYSVKFKHQAARLTDYTMVEGHIDYEKKPGYDDHGHSKDSGEDPYLRGLDGKKIEKNLHKLSASSITYDLARYYKPWVEDTIDIAASKSASVTLAEDFTLEETVAKKGEALSLDLLKKLSEAHLENRAHNSKWRTKYLREAWRMKWADVKENDLLGEAAFASEFPKAFELSAEERSKAYTRWKAGMRSRMATDVSITGVKLSDGTTAKVLIDGEEYKAKTELPTVKFELSEPLLLRYKSHDVITKYTPGATSATLRDATVIDGKYKPSPMVYHYVDGIDFQHFVKEAYRKNLDAEIAIQNSWLIQNNPEIAKMWEMHKEGVRQLEEALAKKGREPIEKDRYRMGWHEIAYYYDIIYNNKDATTDELVAMVEHDPSTAHPPRVKAKLIEHFKGPDYEARHFPHIEIPREQVMLDSKFTPKWNTYYAIYFTITGLHGLHVIGGAIVLGYYLFFGRKMYLTNPEWLANRVEVGGLFWHFVDLVWIFAFPIFYLM